MIPTCTCSFGIVLLYGYIKIIIYIATFVKMFCKFAIAWPVFDVVAMVEETLWQLLSCISNTKDFRQRKYLVFPCSSQYLFIFSVMFNCLLVTSLQYLFAGKVSISEKVINWNGVIDFQYRFSKCNQKGICSFGSWEKTFVWKFLKSLGLLEIRWFQNRWDSVKFRMSCAD